MTKNTKDNTRYVRGGGTVRQRPDGRWEARCTINGKRRSFYGMKQADVLKTMRDAQAEAASKSYIEPSNMTFGEWLDIWYNEYNRPNLKKTTRQRREKTMERLIKPALGEIRLQALDTIAIQRFYNQCLTNGLKAYTVKTWLHSVILPALAQAVKCGYIPSNPADLCTIPRRVKVEFEPFTEGEVATFLELLKDEEPTIRHLFTVILFTGMRIGEALGLPWSAIDFESGTITVGQQLQDAFSRSKAYLDTPKNGKSRTIYPAPIVFETIEAERKQQEANRMIAGDLYDNPLGLVFTNAVGQSIVSSNVRYHFKKIVKQIGRSDMRIHDLRHTYAVMAFNAGDSPKTVQNALGHHTATFTLDVYTHVTEDMARRSAERMQSYYNSIRKKEETT